MSSVQIREAVGKVSRVLADQPEKAHVKNAPATANLVDGLKCLVTGPAGETLQTDMPAGVGGGATAPNPGWLMRAALASCNATCIALRAAKRGINLAKLEVTVSSESEHSRNARARRASVGRHAGSACPCADQRSGHV